MRVLENLEPNRVLSYFEDLCAIPHGSTNTKAISDYCIKFAEGRGLEHYQDEANNVIIVKAATPGYENADTVIVQGHLDMVCEKTHGSAKDMDKEGLDLGVDGDMVYAKDTTLGSDDGIAVAMALAILEADDIPHPRLEAVFTTDEEIGMLGAAKLDMSLLKGRIMLNLDSEGEGIFTVSCAGGVVAECALPVTRRKMDAETYIITVGGLKGGHSGAEIDKGRGMSNQLMGRVLYAANKTAGLRLISVAGGLKDNAIPLKTVAEVTAQDGAALTAVVRTMDAAFKNEYQTADPGVFVQIERNAAHSAEVMTSDETAKAICMLVNLPVGIQTMSMDIPGLVQTSLNMGILKTLDDKITASFCTRSSIGTQKEMLNDRLTCLMEQLGGTVSFYGDYPGWEYKKDSRLRSLMVKVFTEQYGHEPKVEAIHAGVECGLFSGKLPGLDCVSYGPDLLEIHTPRERMSISSVQRTWKLTLEVLKRLK